MLHVPLNKYHERLASAINLILGLESLKYMEISNKSS